MPWVLVGDTTWVRETLRALDGAFRGNVLGPVDAGHALMWPSESDQRGAIVCCAHVGHNGDERWFTALSAATRVIAVSPPQVSSLRVALRLAAQYPACDVVLGDERGHLNTVLLRRAVASWRRASASADLLTRLPGCGTEMQPTVAAGIILAAQVTASVSRTAAMIGRSTATVRAQLTTLGWPPPHVALAWCSALYALWDLTEEGIPLAAQERAHGRGGSEARSKRIREVTGTGAREWVRQGGYRAAVECFRNRLIAGDFGSGANRGRTPA
jgi:hypothetical protein